MERSKPFEPAGPYAEYLWVSAGLSLYVQPKPSLSHMSGSLRWDHLRSQDKESTTAI